MTARVRPATPADTAAIAELEQVAFEGDAWSPALVGEGVAAALPTITYLVAEREDPPAAVVGYAVVSLAGDDAELQRIAVDPSVRRQHIGRALLDAVHARAGGDVGGPAAERLLLEVRDDNAAALAFYRAAGFMELGRRQRYYRDGTTAVILALPLGPASGRRMEA